MISRPEGRNGARLNSDPDCSDSGLIESCCSDPSCLFSGGSDPGTSNDLDCSDSRGDGGDKIQESIVGWTIVEVWIGVTGICTEGTNWGVRLNGVIRLGSSLEGVI